MLEILFAVYLSRSVARIAAKKGLNASRWKKYSLLCWFSFEIFGIIIFMTIADNEGKRTDEPSVIMEMVVKGILLAAAAHIVLRAVLLSRPDIKNDYTS